MIVSRKWLGVAAGAGTVLVAVLALAVYTAPTASAHGGFSFAGGPHGCAGAGVGASGQGLASALGISVDELQAAQLQAHEAALDEAVEQGWLTQKQADLMKERGSRGMGRIRIMGSGMADIDGEALLAEALGITVEQLQEARRKAADSALDDAVESGRITAEQADAMRARQALADYIKEQGVDQRARTVYEDAVDQAVADGVITQEQADRILEGQGFGFHGWGMRGPGGSFNGWGMRGPGHGFGEGAIQRMPLNRGWFEGRGPGTAPVRPLASGTSL